MVNRIVLKYLTAQIEYVSYTVRKLPLVVCCVVISVVDCPVEKRENIKLHKMIQKQSAKEFLLDTYTVVHLSSQ